MSDTDPTLHQPKRPRHRRLTRAGLVVALVLIVGWVGFELVLASVGGTGGTGEAGGGGKAGSLVDWRHDYEQALAEAKQAGRPVLLEFTADWCPPCQWMKRHVYGDPAVAKMIESRFVPVQIDITEQSRSKRRLMQRWLVRGVPTLIMLDSQGAPRSRVPGRMTKQGLRQWLAAGPGADATDAPAGRTQPRDDPANERR